MFGFFGKDEEYESAFQQYDQNAIEQYLYTEFRTNNYIIESIGLIDDYVEVLVNVDLNDGKTNRGYKRIKLSELEQI
jgi:hypothetical protein